MTRCPRHGWRVSVAPRPNRPWTALPGASRTRAVPECRAPSPDRRSTSILDRGPGEDPDGSTANGNAAPGSLADNDLFSQSNVVRAFDAGRGGINPDRFGDDDAQSYSMTAREVLLGSSFTATGEKDAMGGSLAFWGRAAQSSFDGQEGAFSLDGETTTTMLGADYARDNWLVGLALMQGSGKGQVCRYRRHAPSGFPDLPRGSGESE